MAPNSTKKGKELEKAVFFIQDTILKSDPKLKGTKFTIESNQIVTVAGVRHEIDVLVKTAPGSEYQAIYIFECKNWKHPVGKDELVHLSGKVHALGATRGFLVARKLTKDAHAWVATAPRLSFQECSDDFGSPLQFQFFHSVHELSPVKLKIKVRGRDQKTEPDTLETKGKPCVFNGQPIEIAKLVGDIIKKTIPEDQQKHEALYSQPGTHPSPQHMLYEFDQGKFLIGEDDIELGRVFKIIINVTNQ